MNACVNKIHSSNCNYNAHFGLWFWIEIVIFAWRLEEYIQTVPRCAVFYDTTYTCDFDAMFSKYRSNKGLICREYCIEENVKLLIAIAQRKHYAFCDIENLAAIPNVLHRFFWGCCVSIGSVSREIRDRKLHDTWIWSTLAQ